VSTITVLENLRARLIAARDTLQTDYQIDTLASHAQGLRAGLDIGIQAVEWEIHTARIMAGEQPQQGE
jgi:hypothetical protein